LINSCVLMITPREFHLARSGEEAQSRWAAPGGHPRQPCRKSMVQVNGCGGELFISVTWVMEPYVKSENARMFIMP